MPIEENKIGNESTPEANYLDKATKTIKGFEGYAPKGKWDVNAYRAGYGSDTIGIGSQQTRIVKDQPVSKEQAETNLAGRIPEFEQKVIAQVGAEKWASMPDDARAALLSIAYNYGKLPRNVASSINQNQPLSSVAKTVASHAPEQHGINARRRIEEANQIQPGTITNPNAGAFIVQPNNRQVARRPQQRYATHTRNVMRSFL